ncbi:MAG: glycosyltransferase 36 associated protein, partial [Burkholderiaceae bacterium]
KGYPPGLRENGGQYTHGAIWSVFAFALLGEGDRAGSLLALLNPISHSHTPEAVQRYKVEPFVACADVYSVAPHVGRGGWTWYTGSGGWLYRAGLEAILGFKLQGNTLVIEPCIPRVWPGYEIVFRHRGARNLTTCYQIAVENPRHVSRGVAFAELDGARMVDGAARIPLVEDGAVHRVRVVLA